MIDADTVARHDLPGHLRSVPDEIEARDLPVTGALPADLAGRYVRNGPNALPGTTTGHLQVGPGMLHGVRLRGGRAEWYRNRWVRSGAVCGRSFVTPDGRLDLAAANANTHVVRHASRVLALVEVGFPQEVTPDLGTVGPCDFGGRLTTGMTAHPKRDPDTGELHFFGYGMRPPFLTYHRLDAAGRLVRSREVGVPAGTMMHDFAITEHHVVWLDLPMTFDLARVGRGMPYGWDDSYGARLGVMRHDVPDAPVQWFDIEPCFVFHVGNAHEDAAGRVVLDAVRYTRDEFVALWELLSRTITPPPPSAPPVGRGHLHRWTLDPGSGKVAEERLDDRAVEFPTLDDDRVGRPSRYLYTVTGTEPLSKVKSSIVKYDASGAVTAWDMGPDTMLGEAVFVPAGGSGGGARGEDDGWLITIATTRDGTASRLLVLDATDVAAGPVATVELPRGVPTGFHGSWLPD